ncbi:KH domain-containing protein [Ditylenchus destructor]|uniref:KH domain-containing protein n=1 Tax=Ditylenchus destructor TaxID=166010 RepID=A0AAD4MMN8_9BILA|nr:KH domain-containing protein [Ditylenchus destructor]
MKRTSGDDFGKVKKIRYVEPMFNEALEEGKFELRLLIPSRLAGAVIGRGGANINDVSKKYDASLSMPDCSRPERVLAIVCAQEVIDDCFKEVLHYMAEGKRSNLEVRMLIHDSHAGIVLGKKGSFVKEIIEKTETDVHVYKELCPISSDRVVKITGAEEKIVEAVGIIVRELTKFPIKAPQRLYDPINYDPTIAHVYGGFSDGRAPASGVSAWERGRAGEREERMGYIPGPPAMSYSEDYLRGADNMSLQLTVPKEMVGKLAANGGELMHYIQQESGARLDVSITLTGPDRRIRMAQLLLKDSLRGRPADTPAIPAYYDEAPVRRSREVAPPAGFYEDAPLDYNNFA